MYLGDTWSGVGALLAGAVMAVSWLVRKTYGATAEEKFNRVVKRVSVASFTAFAVVVVFLLIYYWAIAGVG
jgi:hypothetical protein